MFKRNRIRIFESFYQATIPDKENKSEFQVMYMLFRKIMD